MAEHTKNARGSTHDKHTNRHTTVANQKKTLNGNFKPNSGKRNRPDTNNGSNGSKKR